MIPVVIPEDGDLEAVKEAYEEVITIVKKLATVQAQPIGILHAPLNRLGYAVFQTG